jgi:translocation and assembly module TamA
VCALPVCPAQAPLSGEPSVPYRARLKGLWRGDLKSAVRAQSQTLSLFRYPPATVRQLRKRAEDDIPAMTGALRASGHLDAAIELEIETNRLPARVTFRICRGPRYTIGDFRVVYSPGSDGVPSIPRWLGWGRHSAASVENVEAAEEAALRFLQERGYPHPKMMKRAVVHDDVRKKVDVTRTVDPGAPATLGTAELQGLVRVHPGYVQNRVPWTPGELYDVEELEDLEQDLLRSGLFASARVAAADEPDAEGRLPVRISLAERPRHTVRAGASYYTDEGFGGEARWENRNLFGNAEALSLTLSASEIESEARSVFTRPDFLSRDLDLHLELSATDEHPDAYRSRGGRYAMWLEKRLGDHLTLEGGGAYEVDLVEEQNDETRFGLFSLPLSVDWDLRDDPLDPSRGAAFRLSTAPYEDTKGEVNFLKSFGEGSLFLQLSRSPRIVLATRATLGTISGEEANDVPADKRFYAGGGGTIRGYKYQSVGEIEDGEPTGGNSIATVSAELRARATRTLGLALFIDGGTAYPGSHPDSDTPFLWGAGVGLRYYLGFAPLRLDMAFPLQPREDVDDPFQIYISLGQSF